MKSMHPTKLLVVLAATIAMASCGQKSAEQPIVEAEPEPVAEPTLSVYEAAVTAPGRSDADRARDANRNPAAVLEFLGIQPGMTVLDMFTGGGYYAEIIAHIVGSEGKVIAQTNKAYLGFVGEEFEQRFADDRLANVEVLMAENNELSLEADSIDAVMLVLSFHDLYLEEEEEGSWPKFDAPAFFAELRKGLKPGGKVAIIDHVATAGSAAEESSNGVHRIDPAVVIADMEAAGFTLSAESDLLRNPDDDLSQNVFAEGIRGNTDRFLMCFSSPD